LVQLSAPTTYDDPDDALPTSEDLAPAGIATRGARVKVEHLHLKRDIYYIATTGDPIREITDYEYPRAMPPWTPNQLADFFASPDRWTADSPLGWRRSVEFTLAADQFFMLGDNSAQSKDSRLWAEGDPSKEFYVRRELMIGKVFFVCWPTFHLVQ
jgi:hypothetical protein